MKNKIIKGDSMPASNGGKTRARLSLLAGSSLAAATIVLSAGGVALAPTAAQAANECVPVGVDPAANGTTADTFACPGDWYPNGITYVTEGNLTVTSGEMDVGTGVNLNGEVGDSVTYTQTGGTYVYTSSPADAVIEVTSVSGAINVSANLVWDDSGETLYGVKATSTGGGAVTISTNSAFIPGGTAAISAVTNGGAINITAAGETVGSVRGIYAQTSGAGAVTITSTGDVSVDADAGVAAIEARTGTGLLTINNTGSISAADEAEIAIVAAGGSFVLANSGDLEGRVNLAGVTGASSITNSGTWDTEGASSFSVGASTLTNSGTLTVMGASTFTGLETFNNSGAVVLGTNTLSAAGTTFTGSGSSRLRITTNLDPAGSTACSFAGSGCLDLTGGTTAGVTSIVLTSTTALSTSYNPGLVLVDVSDGASAAGHFVLDPTSTNYTVDPMLGAVLATGGLFAYSLGYNADTQQHVLASIPGRDAFEFTPIIHEGLAAWHTTTDVVVGRQADLGSGANGGLWVRLAAENSERELVQSFSSSGGAFTADNGYSLETGTAVVGFDLVKGGDVTFGVHGGYVKSTLAFENSDTSDELTGPTVGLYGGWRSGPFSLDGVFNANLLELERTSPTFEDSTTNLASIGGRAEAGWKIGGEPFFVQPIVTAAYVKSTIEDLEPTGYDIAFEDAVSSRAAVGVRAGGEAGPLAMWAVARAWKEFSGDGAVSINNTGTTTGVTFADDLSGDFQEIGAGISLANDADTLRGFVSAGAKLADDIDNYSFSLGVRLRW